MSGSVIKTFADERLLASNFGISFFPSYPFGVAVKGNSFVLEKYPRPRRSNFPFALLFCAITLPIQCTTHWSPSLQCKRFLWARNLLEKAPCWNFPKRGGDGASQRERGGGGEREEKTPYFFSPLPLPSFFFRPRTYRKGYYFYSPQSSTVIKSKMAATTILRTRTRFCPPKIRLHCRLLIALQGCV